MYEARHTHTNSQTLSLSLAHTHTHTNTNTHMRAHKLSRTQHLVGRDIGNGIYAARHTQTQTHTYTHILSLSLSRTHTYARIRIHTFSHSHSTLSEETLEMAYEYEERHSEALVYFESWRDLEIKLLTTDFALVRQRALEVYMNIYIHIYIIYI